MAEQLKKIIKSIPMVKPLLNARLNFKKYYEQYLKEKEHEAAFEEDFRQFKELAKTDRRFSLNPKDCQPRFFDKTSTTPFDKHYVYHLAWATRIVRDINPSCHVDISSYIFFPAMLSAFIPVKFYDYRPADLHLDNLYSGAADLVALDFPDNSIESLSCMHVVEHIGLGRYGDPLNPTGDLKAMHELKRVVAKGGNLLFAVPIGKARVMYNSHRVYGYDQIMEVFSDMELMNYSLITDEGREGGLVSNATKELTDQQSYGCGCFWFRKK